LVALLDDMPPDTPLLLLATAELPASASDAAAAGPGKGSNSRKLLPGPLPIASAAAAAAAAAGCSDGGQYLQQQQQKQKQQPELEALGMEPPLAALFPPLGQLSDIKALLSDLQQQRRRSRSPVEQAAMLLARRPDQQQQRQKQAEDAAAGAGCDLLGWVLLEAPGAFQRRNMFEVRVCDADSLHACIATASAAYAGCFDQCDMCRGVRCCTGSVMFWHSLTGVPHCRPAAL
jgi:hypothetical protein